LVFVEFTDLKAPAPVTGIPPWQDPAWLAAAEAWIDAECARAGLDRAGPALGRARSYSVVARVPVRDGRGTGGTVWFKASPPAASFEPALLAALADWYPDRFTAPVAVDPGRAWSLTRDGGPTLRERNDGTKDVSAWRVLLRVYGQLQFELAAHVDDLLALGLADLRPGRVPGRFERIIADPALESVIDVPGGITRAQYEAVRSRAPQLREWCAELEDLGVAASLDHSDVHPNNVFANTGTPFDWGDAVVSHPFASLLIALRTAADRAGLPARSPEVLALTGEYFRPWLDAGYPRAALGRSLELGLRVAPLARSLAWGRVFPCFTGHPVPGGHAAQVLTWLLAADPLDPED
jgi:hypothetical protein